jgi:hypothetical protein
MDEVLVEYGSDVLTYEPGFQPATPTSPVRPGMQEYEAIGLPGLQEGCGKGRPGLGHLQLGYGLLNGGV